MKEYPFPMDRLSDAGGWTLPIHLLLLALAVLPFIFIFLRSRQPATWSDALVLAIATLTGLVALIFVSTIPDRMPIAFPFLVGYLLFFVFSCSVGLVVTLTRLKRQGQRTLVRFFLAGLLLFGIAIGTFLPAVPAAREAARRMQCANNLKVLALGLSNYESAFRAFPAATSQPAGTAEVSWRVTIQGWIHWDAQLERYDRAQAWDSPANLPFSRLQSPLYSCPSDPRPTNQMGQYHTDYVLVVGPGAPFDRQTPRSPAYYSNGLSNTLGVVEAAGLDIVWTEPRDAELSGGSLGINLTGLRPHTSRGIVSSYHTGGANSSRLDGRVVFLSQDIDPEVLKQMVTPQAQ